MNACLIAKTEFFIAPYFSSPQLLHFFRESMVHAIMGSIQCLLLELPEPNDNELTQIIVDFDLDQGSFSFIDSQELLAKISPK
jgi:hypothetical protein